MIIDVGAAQGRQMIAGSVAAGGIGLIAVASALTGNVEGGTGTRTTALLIGAVFTLIGALPLLLRRIAFRSRRLVFDSAGLRWEDPEGAPWAVGWAELAEVTLSYPASATGSAKLGSVVDLTLRPADPAFHEAHPEMEHLAAPGGDGSPGRRYRMPFGHALSVVGPADRGLRHFAPGIYRQDGPEIPPPRDRPRAVKVSVAIIGCYWAAAVAVALVMDGADLSSLGTAALSIVVAALWLSRVWAGGPLAVARTAWLAQMIGVLGLVALGALGLILLPMTGAGLLPAFLPGLAAAPALLVSGRLLSRDDVRAWTAGRAWGL